jgi:hypothetical protein
LRVGARPSKPERSGNIRQSTVSALSPLLNGVQIKHACRLIGRRKAALEEVRQHFLELLKRQMKPARRLFRRDVARIDAKSDFGRDGCRHG